MVTSPYSRSGLTDTHRYCCLISPYNITPESDINVMIIKDHQLKKLLIVKQILLVGTLVTV